MGKRTMMILTLLCLTLIIAGCQAGALKTRKVLPDWSRGQQLGLAALNRPIHMLPEADYVHMVWVAAESQALHYLRLGATGEVQVNRDLEISRAHPTDPQLLLNADGSLGVLWVDNPGVPRALFLAKFSRDGQLLSGPTRLSPDGARVSSCALAHNLDGSHDVFWSDEIPTDGGVHHVRLSADSQVASASRLLVKNGEHPTLQVAPDRMIHLAWVEEPASQVNHVYYAVFDPSTGELGPATRVGSYRTATGLVSYAPVIGLDDDTGYLFWALEQRGGGLATGEADTYAVSFPLNNPHSTEPVKVDIPGIAKPVYHTTTGNLPYQQLAAADAGWPTSLLYMPATLGGQREELGLFLVAEVATQRKTSREVVWAIFAHGQLKGYQLPIKIGNALRPSAVMDERDNVHLVWLNTGGFGRYDVYHASTSDAVKANLDRVTVQDRAMDFLNASWNLAPALGFFPPIFLLWSMASFLWVLIFYVVKAEGGLDRRPSRIALVVAILLYLFSKLFLIPGVLFYAPFLDTLPENLQFIPVLGTPLFTLLVALGAVWFYFRRAEYRSLFPAYVIFVVTDVLLSLVIYVPRWIEG